MLIKTNIVYLIIVILIALFSCNSGNSDKISTDVVKNPNTASGHSQKSGLPEINFVKMKHDFGNVLQGEVLTFGFKFENSGKSDLLITEVSSSCGCTASKYPKNPVAPGETGAIEVTFNSKGRKGFQAKTVTVVANTQPSKTTLNIEARVKEPGK